jgi:hypothetical protein
MHPLTTYSRGPPPALTFIRVPMAPLSADERFQRCALVSRLTNTSSTSP